MTNHLHTLWHKQPFTRAGNEANGPCKLGWSLRVVKVTTVRCSWLPTGQHIGEASLWGLPGISISQGFLLFLFLRLNTLHRQTTQFMLSLAFLLKVWVLACSGGSETFQIQVSRICGPSSVILFVMPRIKGINRQGARVVRHFLPW